MVVQSGELGSHGNQDRLRRDLRDETRLGQAVFAAAERRREAAAIRERSRHGHRAARGAQLEAPVGWFETAEAIERVELCGDQSSPERDVFGREADGKLDDAGSLQRPQGVETKYGHVPPGQLRDS
jgi:hypothetical protein